MGAYSVRNSTASRIKYNTNKKWPSPTIPGYNGSKNSSNGTTVVICENNNNFNCNWLQPEPQQNLLTGLRTVLNALGNTTNATARLINTCNSKNSSSKQNVTNTTNTNQNNATSIQNQVNTLNNLYSSKANVQFDSSTQSYLATDPNTGKTITSGSYNDVADFLSNYSKTNS